MNTRRENAAPKKKVNFEKSVAQHIALSFPDTCKDLPALHTSGAQILAYMPTQFRGGLILKRGTKIQFTVK